MHQSRISCVSISDFCHACIRCAAVVEYGADGSGVLSNGGGGSTGDTCVGAGKLCAQAVSSAAGSSGSSRIGFGPVLGLLDGVIFCSL